MKLNSAFNKPKIYIVGTLVAGLFSLSQIFTNCSHQGGYPQEVQSLTLGLDHPSVVAKSDAAYLSPLGHSQYMATILTEIFSTPSSPAGYVSTLNSLVTTNAVFQGPQLGLACDPNDSYSGDNCGGNITNANLPMYRESTPIRESLMLRLCSEILGNNEAVEAAMKNAQILASSPDRASVESLVELFYRGDLPGNGFIDTLLEMDQHLDAENTATQDRWRMLLVEICETSGWQRL